ncbi:MAG: hypothetical protein FJW20_03000 [Acidimicrobiia bacterium]|nr:hypothetical protein [Acidimicrobiia bacterium]
MRRLFLKLLLGAPTFVSAVWAQEAKPEHAKSLTTEELKEIVEGKAKYFFLDVREPKELEDLGTIKGYVNIPVSQMEKRISEIPKDVYVVVA